MEPAPPVNNNNPEESKKESSIDSSISNKNLEGQNYMKNGIMNNNLDVKNNIPNIAHQNFNSEIINVEQRDSLNDRIIINLNIRSKFMLKVFGILIFQLLFTFCFVLICQINSIKKFLLSHTTLCYTTVGIASFVFIIILIIFLCEPRSIREFPYNYILLTLVTISQTIILIYITVAFKAHIVVGAIAILIGFCVAIIVISLCNKIDIKYCYFMIWFLVFELITYGILLAVYRNYYLELLYCLIGCALFSFYIAFDTINIRDHFDIDDYAFAALTLYIDIIRLFIEILKLIGKLTKNK